ncbi:Uu.00g145960.m01.CDS01 [Anthostomella pinea]|uniref:non-specific serine/threonine protein kinase n=1 Tax=Anthostomella pinea TaxID=933095 RepID=A0AAI8VR66_9PEZI|nr:Uu.00g145960.m01.CDS01 [Anthostomella pinea]
MAETTSGDASASSLPEQSEMVSVLVSGEQGTNEQDVDEPATDDQGTGEQGTDESETQEYVYDYLVSQFGIEDIDRYNKGGFYPVHIADILDDRWEVNHKLGSGGFGTVWLCRDLKEAKWRAVNVMAADHSSSGKEAEILQHLAQESTPEELDANYIAAPLEQFWLESVNGRHLCLVMPVFGYTVDDWPRGQDNQSEETGLAASEICSQVAKALRFLHAKGDALHKLDEDQLHELMGVPQAYPVETKSGVDPRPIAPDYCIHPPKGKWCKELLTNDIVIVDFGESFLTRNPPETNGIPTSYAAPEILFAEPGPESDIWSLACIFHEIRSGKQLFGASFEGSSLSRVVYEIEVLLGELPNPYRAVRDREGFEGPRHISVLVEDEDQKSLRAATCSRGTLQRAKGDSICETSYTDVFEAYLGKERELYLPSEN